MVQIFFCEMNVALIFFFALESISFSSFSFCKSCVKLCKARCSCYFCGNLFDIIQQKVIDNCCPMGQFSHQLRQNITCSFTLRDHSSITSACFDLFQTHPSYQQTSPFPFILLKHNVSISSFDFDDRISAFFMAILKVFNLFQERFLN